MLCLKQTVVLYNKCYINVLLRADHKVTDLHKVTLGYTRIDRITCFPLHRVLADFIINGPCISKEPYFSELSCRRQVQELAMLCVFSTIVPSFAIYVKRPH